MPVNEVSAPFGQPDDVGAWGSPIDSNATGFSAHTSQGWASEAGSLSEALDAWAQRAGRSRGSTAGTQ